MWLGRFGCLDNSDYHPWVKTIFMMARSGTVLQAATHYPLLKKLLFSLIPKRIMEDHSKHEEMTMLKLKRRMELEHERPDLIEGLLRQKDQWVCAKLPRPYLEQYQQLMMPDRVLPWASCKQTPAFL